VIPPYVNQFHLVGNWQRFSVRLHSPFYQKIMDIYAAGIKCTKDPPTTNHIQNSILREVHDGAVSVDDKAGLNSM
jgi:hypothetical protein